MTSNPVHQFFYSRSTLGATLLRWLLCGFFFVSGAQRAFGWFGGSGWQSAVADLMANPGPGWSYAGAAAFIAMELLLAGLLFLGLFTRLAAFLSLLIWLWPVIYGLQQAAPAFDQIGIVLSVVSLALLSLGGGRFSMDRGISNQLLPQVG